MKLKMFMYNVPLYELKSWKTNDGNEKQHDNFNHEGMSASEN